MAARLKPRHQDEIRAKIKVAKYISQFDQCFDGERILTDQQVSIAKFLINKVLPDLKAVEHSGEVDSSVFHIHLGK